MRFPLWRQKRRNQELREEVQAHLTLAETEEMASGRTRKQAQIAARREFGNVTLVEETTRDVWGWRWLTDLSQDVRYALRSLRQRPGFVAVALLTLALGTGATTVMFTVIYGVLLKPLPYPDPGALVAVHGHSDDWKTEIYGEQNVAHLDFLDCQRQSRSLDLAGFVFESGTVSAPGDPQYVQLRQASANLFSVLGVPLLRGRTFLPEEDEAGGAPVAILGYSFWQHLLAGSPTALGSSLVLDDKRYTIVGIAAANFRLYGDEPDLYIPMNQNTARYMQTRHAHPVNVVARLRPGGTLVQAQTELGLIGRHLAEQFPDTNAKRSFLVTPLRPDVGDVRSTLWLLFGAVSLVLLIACANVASLMLARAVSREREFALRAALGATRNRIVRQCLTESAVLGLFGGFLGILVADLSARPFAAFWPGALPRAEEVQLNWPVLLFTLGVSLLNGFLFGLAPALRVPARDVEQILRSGSRTVAGSSRRLHSGFVVSEIALAIVLLVSAGMLGRTLVRLSTLDPGLNIRNVLVTRMALSPATLADPAKTRAAWKDVLERARRVPGVQSISTVDTFPMRSGENEQGYSTSADLPPSNKLPFTLLTSVSPDYLKVMGIPLRQGRFFDDHDTLNTTPVVVIDEVLAQDAFGTQDPVGKRLWIPEAGYGSNVFSIVGVVGHVRHWGLAADDQAKVRAQLYYPFAQLPDSFLHRWSQLMSIAVRTTVPPLSLVSSLRSELRGATGDQVLYEVRTMDQLAHSSLALQRFLLLLFGIFAGLALLLACIGIYGVLAYLTSQRIPEIGIRMALGAHAADVIWLVLRQSIAMILMGVALGTFAALAASRIMLSLVEGMQPTALSSFAIMLPVLIVAALFASFLPARRASRVDPLVALRYE